MSFKALLTNFTLLFILNACGGATNTTKDVNSTLTNPLFKQINIGFGASGAFPFMGNNGSAVWISSADLILNKNIGNNNTYQTIKNFNVAQFNILQTYLKNTKFVGYWFTKYWSTTWFNLSKIQKLMDNGYIPVFHYWYFGDTLQNHFPTGQEINDYHVNNAKLASFLAQLHGEFLIIMEPEFNKSVITNTATNQHNFATIIANAIDIIKKGNTQALFSLCMTDTGRRDASSIDPTCGYKNCALGDINAWDIPKIIYNDLSKKLDFVSFQEMVGQFHRNSLNPGSWNSPIPISSTDIGTGITFLPQRISNFSKYLSNKYNKPIFLPYVAIPTETWIDSNNDNVIQKSELNPVGWETQASNAYQGLMQRKQELLNNNLFGFSTISLFDDPQHDIGGYQYFINNEYHMGIIKTTAKDKVDKYPFGDIVFKGSIINTLFF